MKTLAINISLTLTMLVCVTVNANAEAGQMAVDRDSVETIEMARVLLSRLDAINAAEKSTLGSAETRKLRKEVRRIKGNLRELKGGSHLRIGAVCLLLLVPVVVFNVSE